MRFYLDHDVPVRLAKVLRDLGHDVWTTTESGLTTAPDSEQAIYAAEKDAVLITSDVAFKRKSKAQAGCQMVFIPGGYSLDEMTKLIVDNIDDIVGVFKNGNPGLCELRDGPMKVSTGWDLDAPENP